MARSISTRYRQTALLCAAALVVTACAAPAQAPPVASTVPAPPTTAPPTAIPPTVAPAIVPPPVVLATPRPTEAARAPVSDVALVKLVDDYVAPLTKQDKFGGAVLIARDGKVVLNQGYGYADPVKSTAIETDTQFLVGMAQWNPMAAVLALQLQQDGRLSLDDSVCNYVTPCDNRFKPITLRLLLSNMGGLPDGRYVPEVELGPGVYVGQFFSNLAKAPPERFARPGEAFQLATLPSGARVPAHYGNARAIMWGLSGVVGMDAIALCNVRFFGPLNVKSYGIYKFDHDKKSAVPRDATLPIDWIQRGYLSHLMSAADLNTFLQALFDGTLLSATQLNEMLRPVVKVDGAPGSMGYAMGAYAGTDPTGRRVVSQVDVAAGYGAYWAYYPDEKLTVIVLNNVTDWANQPYRARDVGLALARRIVEAK